MSQHLFKTVSNNIPITVVAGWDRQLQGFFLGIEAADDELLFDNGMNYPKSFDEFQLVLNSFDIKIPNEMSDEINHDMINNVGNKIKDWSYSSENNDMSSLVTPTQRN